MFKPHTLMAGICLISSSAFSDVIFSEYIEGSSNNKALELMNMGPDAADLSEYSIELYSNGNITVQNQVTLSGSLAAGSVFVIANSSAVSDITGVADITSTVTYFNGNDALVLKHNGVVVDRIGQVGNSDTYGANVTLVRNESIVTGDPAFDTPFDATIQWTAYPQDTFAYLGNGDTGSGEDPVADLTCYNPAELISSIQSDGASSPLDGSSVVVEAVVVADLQDSSEMRGFFLQEEDADTDANALTSEGLFVYHTADDVNVGDRIRLSASVDEYYGFTQLNQVQELVVCDTGVALPSAASFGLPVSSAADFEAVEGMRVSFNDVLTVNEVYNLGRYGEILVSNGRRFIPTEIALPGDAADVIRTVNQNNALLVEDGIRYQNPDPVIFPAPGLSADNTLRVGNTINGLTGVMNFAYGAYKLIPTSAPAFENTNARTDAPESVAENDLRVASFNVLNYFNGDGMGEGFPTARGANTAEELTRQTAKLVSAITALDADVVALMEIENDGYAEYSAIDELTRALNAELSVEDQYAFVDPGVNQIGDDVIAVGLIYRPSAVSMTGLSAILDSSNSPLNKEGEPLFIDDLNRPALAQTFSDLRTGTDFTVVVNHFKSKGSSNCADYNDCDSGQGAYNTARTNAALALDTWLQSYPTGVETDHVMITGDLNAYSMEDPVRTLNSKGYSRVSPEGGYSYVYSGETGTLDHALVSSSLLGSVSQVQYWHINTDEPRLLDYNTEFKSEAQILSMYAPNAYRSSDHDPVVVDLSFNQAPVAQFQTIPFFFWTVFISDSYDPDGELASEVFSFGNYEVHKPWLVLSNWTIRRLRLQEVTLTVTDDFGAIDSVTQSIR